MVPGDYREVISLKNKKTKTKFKFKYLFFILYRQLQWDWTAAGKEVVQPCPIGATGHARWTCALVIKEEEERRAAEWATERPDMSDCKLVSHTYMEGGEII